MGWESEVGFWESKRRTSSFIRSDTFWWSSSSIAANGFSRKWWKFFVFFFSNLVSEWRVWEGFLLCAFVFFFFVWARKWESTFWNDGFLLIKGTLHTTFAMSLWVWAQHSGAAAVAIEIEIPTTGSLLLYTLYDIIINWQVEHFLIIS